MAVFNKLQSLIRYIRGFIGLQRDDIILAAYPKSGSTWLRFLFCNIGSLLEWKGRAVDFEILNKTMLSLTGNILKPWAFTSIPRVIITHRPYIPIFRRNKSILLIRDSRDVMVSHFHYRKAIKSNPWEGTFSQFIRNRSFGLEAWCKHFLSWQKYYYLLVTYENLQKDTYNELQRVLNFLGLEFNEKVILEAIQRSSFSSVRAIEESRGLVGGNQLIEGSRFTRDGSVGGWCKWFTKEDLNYFKSILIKNKIRIPQID